LGDGGRQPTASGMSSISILARRDAPSLRPSRRFRLIRRAQGEVESRCRLSGTPGPGRPGGDAGQGRPPSSPPSGKVRLLGAPVRHTAAPASAKKRRRPSTPCWRRSRATDQNFRLVKIAFISPSHLRSKKDRLSKKIDHLRAARDAETRIGQARSDRTVRSGEPRHRHRGSALGRGFGFDGASYLTGHRRATRPPGGSQASPSPRVARLPQLREELTVGSEALLAVGPDVGEVGQRRGRGLALLGTFNAGRGDRPDGVGLDVEHLGG
jgi:hypothetical protein